MLSLIPEENSHLFYYDKLFALSPKADLGSRHDVTTESMKLMSWIKYFLRKIFPFFSGWVSVGAIETTYKWHLKAKLLTYRTTVNFLFRLLIIFNIGGKTNIDKYALSHQFSNFLISRPFYALKSCKDLGELRLYLLIIPTLIKDQWIFIYTSAIYLLWYYKSYRLWKTPLYSNEKMRVKRGNNSLMLLWKYFWSHRLKWSQEPSWFPGWCFEKFCLRQN